MPARVAKGLTRIRALAAAGKVSFTLKALRELMALDLDSVDAIETMQGLRSSDFVWRGVSEVTGEWMYVFKPRVGGILVYIKLILRTDCVVISFHEDEGDGDEEDV